MKSTIKKEQEQATSSKGPSFPDLSRFAVEYEAQCGNFCEVDYYGVSCELPKGHAGKHAYFWTDEQGEARA